MLILSKHRVVLLIQGCHTLPLALYSVIDQSDHSLELLLISLQCQFYLSSLFRYKFHIIFYHSRAKRR